eukprot:gnl/TRDRNA2_/TRDRNA2_42857_c0_seq1.p1 gnl/TRDRNA2_/TRDRNA2_42857_c0~~gnl/TRDRNA2_/TRDRNA2_42857_c0_seq1.p1  ORF type:complete len:227 (+),score=15.99 gnl/TRDRNA2_/TRDRNA2_42857_c0_seq1:133-813(+)
MQLILFILGMLCTAYCSTAVESDAASLIRIVTKSENKAPEDLKDRDNKESRYCKITFREGRDCSGYTFADFFKVVIDNWDYFTAQCKLDNPDPCLWQGCLAEGNLTKGAEYYIAQHGTNMAEAVYCFSEHCHNTEFDMEKTTLKDAEEYCDRKHPSWRTQMVGFRGYGPPGPGSGTWECAHGNYHCDWGYCKFAYCDNPKYAKLNAIHSLLKRFGSGTRRVLGWAP